MAAPIVTNICSHCGVSFKAKGTLTRQCSRECCFWAHVRKQGDCYIWSRISKSTGYGLVYFGAKEMRAHRFAYETFKGPIPPKMSICHSCDNPACVNPAHLFAGTHKDNMHDMLRKGRSKIGRSDNYVSKLTRDDVVAIRKDGRHDAEIAADYGVCESTIYLARTKRTWTDID